jgi:hypothetical protein
MHPNPVLGILTVKATVPIYINSTSSLLMGNFMLALTMEDWKLHKRIDLFIIGDNGSGMTDAVKEKICGSFQAGKRSPKDRGVVSSDWYH